LRFILNALLVALILGTSLNSYANLPKENIESLQDALPVELTVPVSWRTCGDWNGFYYYASESIVLCEENLALPDGAARMLFLHELGHAYSIPRRLDTRRWNGNWEDEADEFAMIISLAQGRPNDLLVMARVWEKWAKENPPIDGDTHSPATQRAARLRAMYWGYTLQVGANFFYYKEALDYWKARFIESEYGLT
jgi:hypothetical protein